MTRVVFSLKTGGYSFWPKQFLVSPFLPSRWEEKKEEKHTFHGYMVVYLLCLALNILLNLLPKQDGSGTVHDVRW